MRLTDDQLQEFDEAGYLFLPDVFSAAETALLRREADTCFAMQREEVWREDNGAPRSAFAAHRYNEAYRRIAAHPRLLEPVMQILDGQVYMHQFKINAKAAFDGAVWQWHQDYGTWQRDDDMPEPRAMNIAVFLDDVTAANGPLILLPGSHRLGVLEASHDLETTTYPLWCLDRETVRELAERGGVVAPTGKAGCVLMFHSNMAHASPPNISPLSRVIVYLSLCEVSNHIRRFQRAEWRALRDFAPIEPLADDCLEELIRLQEISTPISTHATTVWIHSMNLFRLLQERVAEGRPVTVGLIGAGKFGSMFLAQARTTPGLRVAAIADLDPDRARAALAATGWPDETCGARSRAAALEHGTIHLTDDPFELIAADGVEVVIDATGNPPAGLAHARAAIANGKHIVMANVEADVLAGPLLAFEARRPGWSTRWPTATSRR